MMSRRVRRCGFVGVSSVAVLLASLTAATGPASATASDAPVISFINPKRGIAQGHTITIQGANFGPGTTVSVDGVPARNVRVLSDSVLTAEVIANSPGVKDVNVTVPGYGTATLPASYEPINTVTAYTPGAGGYTVPDSVAGVWVQAAGGDGGSTGESNAGRGGAVSAYLPTTSDEILDLFVGSAGSLNGGLSAGGGGATNLLAGDPRMVVAGGGGGAGSAAGGGNAGANSNGAGSSGGGDDSGGGGGLGNGGSGGDADIGNDGASGGLGLSGGGSGGMGGGDSGGAGGAGEPNASGTGGNAGADTYAGGGGGGYGGGGGGAGYAFGDGGGGGGSIGPSLSGFAAPKYSVHNATNPPGSPGALVITALAQPLDSFAAPGPGPGQVTVTWQPANSQPVSGVTYTVWAQSATQVPFSTGVTTSGQSVTGLTSGTPYSFMVVASTANGMRTLGPPVNATPN